MPTVKALDHSQVDEGKRARDDYGDLKKLAKSIKEKGQLQPGVVVDKRKVENINDFAHAERLDPDKPYFLLIGGRRFFATEALQRPFEAKVYERSVTELEYRALELEENVNRKDLSWQEETKLKEEIHRLHEKIKGKAKHGTGAKGAHRVEDTAEIFGESVSNMWKDLKLADAIKEYPEIAEKANSKSQARNMQRKLEEAKERKKREQELSKKEKRTKTEKLKQELCDAYHVADWFDFAQELPENSFNLVEMDPPYGINFDKYVDGSFNRPNPSRYKDIDMESIDDFMIRSIQSAKRVLKDHAWLIFWFSTKHHFERSKYWLEQSGFTVPNLPAVWNTRSGRCRVPQYHLASDTEMFWYARVGTPKIVKQGRSNVFDFRRVSHSQRTHPNQAPIELYEAIFRTFCRSKHSVCVPYAGSGAAIFAAHNLGLNVVGCDLDAATESKEQGQYKADFVNRVWDGTLRKYKSYDG